MKIEHSGLPLLLPPNTFFCCFEGPQSSKCPTEVRYVMPVFQHDKSIT